MFHKEFYPTPPALIRKLLRPFMLRGSGREEWMKPLGSIGDRFILEPSAGKGDIVNFIQDSGYKLRRLDCVEINPDLADLLRGAGHRVVGSDFLEFKPEILYDLIVMNPPFSSGVEHLLYAWDCLKKGDVACILNASSLNFQLDSRYNSRFKRIIEEHGHYEIVEKAFEDAERQTKVDVALIWLHKPSSAQEDPFFWQGAEVEDNTITDFDEDSISQSTKLKKQDAIVDHVHYYNEAKIALLEMMKGYSKLRYYLAPLIGEGRYSDPTAKLFESAFKEDAQPDLVHNEVIAEINRMAWMNVFHKTKLKSLLTSKVQDNFQEWCQQNGSMAFTEDAIEKIFETLFMNRGAIMDQAILDSFDKMTAYHKDNRLGVEGWKSNSAHKVNHRCIMPDVIEWRNYRTDSGRFGIRYHSRAEAVLDDLDKALCLITGEKYHAEVVDGKKVSGITTGTQALNERFEELGDVSRGTRFDNKVFSTFFEIRFWKKGTLHVYFRDKWVWEQFNIRVGQLRNWLPENYQNEEKPTQEYPVMSVIPKGSEEIAWKEQEATDWIELKG